MYTISDADHRNGRRARHGTMQALTLRVYSCYAAMLLYAVNSYTLLASESRLS